jgi:putative two-component system response regulator
MGQQSILAVDDTRANVDMLLAILGDYYEVSVAMDGSTAVDMALRFQPDLILLDLMMPGMDGYAVLERLKANPQTAEIPVLLVSALSEVQDKTRGFALGAVDFVTKPFEIEELLARVRTHLLLVRVQRQLREQNHNLERLVQERTRELIRIQQATIESMAALAEYRDPETGEHIQRVQAYVEHIAQTARKLPEFAMLRDDHYVDSLILASPLHDIGKVGIPDAILLKPGPLSAEEFEAMKRHTILGREVICRAERKIGPIPFLQVAKDVACYHHEKWDGSGYPEGLSGEAIPVGARIMALADVYDALICRRVYKPPFPHTQAVAIIAQGRGTHFDPRLTDIFTAEHEAFRDIALRFAESDEQREALQQ